MTPCPICGVPTGPDGHWCPRGHPQLKPKVAPTRRDVIEARAGVAIIVGVLAGGWLLLRLLGLTL